MSGEGLGPEEGQLPIDEDARRQATMQMLELVRQYRGADNVPDEELTGLGYVRMPDGALLPADIAATRQDTQMHHASTLADKNMRKPFEPIDVVMPGGMVGRRLNTDMVRAFRGIEDTLAGELIHAYEVTDRSERFFSPLAKKTANWLLGANMPEELPFAEATFLHRLADDVIDDINIDRSNYPYRPSEEFLGESVITLYSDDGITLPAEQVPNVSSEIEYQRGHWADLSLHTAEEHRRLVFDPSEERLDVAYDAQYYGDIARTPEEEALIEQSVRAYVDGLAQRGVEAPAQIGLYGLGLLIESKIPEVECAEQLGHCENMSQARIVVAEVMQTVQAARKRAFKDAKARLAAVQVGEEGRTEAENDLNEARVAMKDSATFAAGMDELMNKPQVFVDGANRTFDRMQKLLMKDASGSTTTLHLVSGIDEEQDADPGKVSGDCTEGKPLPFLEPENDLFNVKVSVGGEHIGNTYLLRVSDQAGDPVAWHLDAVQVPKYGIDWRKGAPRFFEALLTAAQDEGVEVITVNNEPALISNYDYISDGIMDVTERVRSSDPLRDVVARNIKKVNLYGDDELAGGGVEDEDEDEDDMEEDMTMAPYSQLQFSDLHGLRRFPPARRSSRRRQD